MLVENLKTNFLFLRPHAVNWEMESYRTLVARKCTKCDHSSYLQHSYSPENPQGEVVRKGLCRYCEAPLMPLGAKPLLEPLFYGAEGVLVLDGHWPMARLAELAMQCCCFVTDAKGAETGIGVLALSPRGFEWSLAETFILAGECPPLTVVQGICRTFSSGQLTVGLRSACARTCQAAESRAVHTGNYFRGLCSGKY